MIYKIKELMTVNRGSSPRPIIEYLSNSGFRWLKISDFNYRDKFVYNTKEYIKEIKNTKYVKAGTLVLTNSATPGIPIFLGKDMCLHDGFLYFTNIRDKVNINYIFYWFQNYRDSILNLANGSVFKNLKKEIVENLEMDLPSINIQNKVVYILDNINNKINSNNKINNNLLEIIDNLYKNEFVDIKEYKKAEEIANVTIGKTPPRGNKECFSTNNEAVKWVSIADLGKCGTYILDTSEKLTKEAVDSYNVKVIPKNTIILSFKLTVGRIAITSQEMTTNEAIAHFNLENKDMIYYLYSYLKNFDYEKLGSTSSIATAVNSKIIKAMPIAIPKKEVLKNYNEKVSSMFEKIRENEFENKNLEQLRDALLPKLMNGEIDLDNVEI